MTSKEDNVKILKLIALFKKNPKLAIITAAEQIGTSRARATIVKHWVIDGCRGEFNPNKSRKDYRVRKKSKRSIEVECLGPNHTSPYKFWSESKFIRLCPNCTASRKSIISDEFDD